MNDMSGTEAESYVLKTAFFSVTPPIIMPIGLVHAGVSQNVTFWVVR